MYRDFFEFVPPGTARLHFFLFELFGLRPWIPNVLILVLGLALLWVGVVISRKLMSASFALLPSALYLVAFRSYLPDFSHHCFSMLAVRVAIALVIDRRTLAQLQRLVSFAGLALASRKPEALLRFWDLQCFSCGKLATGGRVGERSAKVRLYSRLFLQQHSCW